MGGGNGIVDGFRRLFHRRTPSGSVLGNSSNQSSAGEDPSDVEAVEDLDLVGLRPIRVPKRKMPLPVESHKKVRAVFSTNSVLLVSSSNLLLDASSLGAQEGG
jgi:hypothetical protein